MDWLNYHHLLYFWIVAREGSMTRACEQLRLAKPTISGQIHQLEEVLGEKLFERRGRYLALTEVGQIAYRYAEEIFSVGQELMEAIKGRDPNRPVRLDVGVAGILPKLIVRLLLEPALHLGVPVQINCHEDKSLEEFVAELSVHKLNVVLADAPVGPGIKVKVFSHLLGECGTTFFATKSLATSNRRKFPRSLDGVPFFLPSSKSTLRRSLDQWFHSQKIRPTILGEFDDPALMNVFGENGAGIFPGPTVIEAELKQRYQVQVVGRAKALRQRFYAISVESRLKHPAAVAIWESGRKALFG